MEPAEPPADEAWIAEFFDAENIVHTMQSLLRGGGRTISDLCKMCIAAHCSDLVPAFTPEGLMPFSNNYAYVFQYSDMTKRQVRALVAIIDSMTGGNRSMRCVHENDFYIMPINKDFLRVRDEVLLFGAAAFMTKGITHSLHTSDGQLVHDAVPEVERERIINAALFRIVNSCVLKRGALRESMQMLEAHTARQVWRPPADEHAHRKEGVAHFNK